MADIDGLVGYNSPQGVNKLIAAYGNDLVDVNTGLGYGQNITAGNKWDFEVFIDRVFGVNGANKNRSLGSDNTWSTDVSQPPQLVAKYVKDYKSQLYYGNVVLTPGNGTPLSLKSRVYKSQFPTVQVNPAGGVFTYSLEWGLETGTCTILPNSSLVQGKFNSTSGFPDFISRGIQVGDPFFLLGGDVGEYTVAEVLDRYTLRLVETPSTTAANTNQPFWVGRNWFDVGTDDNDEITGFGENADRLLIFKLFSLFYYANGQQKQIKGPGTSSFRSIINDIRTGDTYFFHGSDPKLTGIYKVQGNQSILWSRAIDPFIRGMSTASYDDVVSWQEGNEMRFFLGDLTNTNFGISMSNAVATLNVDTQAWDISPIADVIRASTRYIVSNEQKAYLGNSNGEVYKADTGYAFGVLPVSAKLETKVYYPAGPEVINEFVYAQVIGRNVKGTRLKYKLYNNPTGVDDNWQGLGELLDDKTELTFPLNHNQASGIKLQFSEMGVRENDTYIEYVVLWYKPGRTRLK